MKVVSAAFVPYKLQFRAPVKTPSGTMTHREGFILRLQDSTGRYGYGDAAPWPGFGTSLAAVQRTLELLTREDGPLCGAAFKSIEDVRTWGADRHLPAETAHAAELALLDLLAASQGDAVAELFCEEPRPVVELHALVPDAVSAKEAVRGGARAVKVKIGRLPLAEEVTRVGAVRAAVGPDVGLRLDANGAWDQETAVRAAKLLAGFAPDWIEQPLPPGDVEALAAVRREGAVPIAVDESAQRLEDLEAVISASAADVLVVKPMFAGGLMAAQKLAQRAAAAGMKVMVTHAMESAVGRVGAMHLAASLTDVSLLACGLSDPLDEDVAKAPVATGGWVSIPPSVGLGVNPSAYFKAALAGEVTSSQEAAAR